MSDAPVVLSGDPGAITGLVLTEFGSAGPRLCIKAQVGQRQPARCASLVEVRSSLAQIAELAPKAGVKAPPSSWRFAAEAWFVGPNPSTLAHTLRGHFYLEAAVAELFGKSLILVHNAQWKSRWLGSLYALMGGAELHRVAVARVLKEQRVKVSSDIACAYGVGYAVGVQLGVAPSRARVKPEKSPTPKATRPKEHVP